MKDINKDSKVKWRIVKILSSFNITDLFIIFIILKAIILCSERKLLVRPIGTTLNSFSRMFFFFHKNVKELKSIELNISKGNRNSIFQSVYMHINHIYFYFVISTTLLLQFIKKCCLVLFAFF